MYKGKPHAHNLQVAKSVQIVNYTNNQYLLPRLSPWELQDAWPMVKKKMIECSLIMIKAMSVKKEHRIMNHESVQIGLKVCNRA